MLVREHRMILERKNEHERDKRVWMDESIHVYYLDDKPLNLSVSGLWGQFFPHFDPEGCLTTYYDKWKANKESSYFRLIQYLGIVKGMEDEEIREEIKRMWSSNGDSASGKGTFMHRQIELFLNGEEHDADSHEMRLFFRWMEGFKPGTGLEPYRTEWSIFDEDAMVAGQIDSVFRDAEGGLWMVDWKRCDPTPRSSKKPLDLLGPKMECFRGETGLGPCSGVPNTKFGHYAIQQNVYKFILEKNYGVKLKGMYLAQFHPAMQDPHCVEVPDLQDVVREIMEIRSCSVGFED